VKSPNQSEFIELAKAYVALSNAHALDLISKMFADNARYQSTRVGEFAGKAEIREMMEQFFKRYPDVFWSVNQYRYMAKGLIEFDFTLAANDAESGQLIESKGIESVQFNHAGLIDLILVSAD
jgi:hypothetical protein